MNAPKPRGKCKTCPHPSHQHECRVQLSAVRRVLSGLIACGCNYNEPPKGRTDPASTHRVVKKIIARLKGERDETPKVRLSPGEGVSL